MTLLVMVNNDVIVVSVQPEVDGKTLCHHHSQQPNYARFIQLL